MDRPVLVGKDIFERTSELAAVLRSSASDRLGNSWTVGGRSGLCLAVV